MGSNISEKSATSIFRIEFSTLKIEAASFSKTLTFIYQSNGITSKKTLIFIQVSIYRLHSSEYSLWHVLLLRHWDHGFKYHLRHGYMSFFYMLVQVQGQSWLPCNLRHRCEAARLLGLRVWILLRTQVFVSCLLCKQKPLQWADHSFTGILLSVCVCVT
jgi:hypothetical protein